MKGFNLLALGVVLSVALAIATVVSFLMAQNAPVPHDLHSALDFFVPYRLSIYFFGGFYVIGRATLKYYDKCSLAMRRV